MNAQSATAIEPHEPHWISRLSFTVVSALFFSTQAALGVAVHHGWTWLAAPLALIVSHLMHGFSIGFHEASHGMLRKNRLVNEIDGILLGAMSFMSFTLHRVVHQTHHAHLASERDQEMSPLVQARIPRWWRRAAAFLELNAGLIFSPLIFLKAFLCADSPVRSPRVRQRIWAELALCAALWTGILWAIGHWNAWKYFLWMYLAPAYLAANLQSWRKYREHVGMSGSRVNSSTRSIVSDSWLGRVVAFTLLHEPFHGVHHQCAGLAHAELPQRVAELEPKGPHERDPYPRYPHAMWDLLRSLADPRAGAQW
nr:fatty acid desaturase [Verrucomicrobiota bacterium]